jgi:type I restriction enzyme S subunit
MVKNGQKFSLGQRVMMLRPDRNLVEPKFLLYQWLSPLIYQEQIIDRMKGSASPHLNISAVRLLSFVLPPLEEQRRLVVYLDDFSAKGELIKSHQKTSAAELDALLPSILDKAFRGEL